MTNVKRAMRKDDGINEIRAWLNHTPSLTEHERATILDRSASMMHRIDRIGKDNEILAKDMLTVQKILKPKRLWNRWLALSCWKRYGASRAKCHRILKQYKVRGIVEQSPAVRAGLAAPAKKRPEIVVVHKKEESATHQTQQPVTITPARGRWRSALSAEQAAIETFDHWRSRIDLVSGKEKGRSLEILASWQLTYLGMGANRFEPQALPEGMRKRSKPGKTNTRQLSKRAA